MNVQGNRCRVSGSGLRIAGSRSSTPGPRHASPGFTLLEVLLALFIVGTAAALLSGGYTRNLRAISASRVDSTLVFLAQWRMSEVAAGIISSESHNEGTFEEEGYPTYQWSIESLPTETPGLEEVSVTVQQVIDDVRGRKLTFHRLVYRPEDLLEFGS